MEDPLHKMMFPDSTLETKDEEIIELIRCLSES
jgi:hypothetical protein